MGREQKAEDVGLVTNYKVGTDKQKEAIIGKLPQKTKDKGLVSYLSEGGAAMANKKKQSDDAVMTGIASGTK